MLRKILLAIAALMLCTAIAQAESPQDAALTLHPGAEVAVLAEKSDAVALALTQGEARILCMVEKIDGVWTVTIDNPTALRQWGGLPRAFFGADSAFTWVYEVSHTNEVCRDTYHAPWQGPGRWGTVDVLFETEQTAWPHTYAIWMEDGKLRRVNTYPERGVQRVYMPIPAAGFEEAATLARFDVESEAFPYAGEYDFWPGAEVKRHAAAELFPNMTYRGGSLPDYGGMAYQTMRFLMEKQSGELVLACCLYNERTGSYDVTESTPLPEGSYYGVENFTDHLGIPHYGAVGVGYADGVWFVSDVWPHDAQGCIDQLNAGPAWVGDAGNYGCRRVFGEGHWADITGIDWAHLPVTMEDAVRQMDIRGWAVVNNPNPADRLHLRTEPDTGAQSLGKYYNGTGVRVLETRGDWAKVSIGGVEGWMMKKFLAFGADMMTVKDAFLARRAKSDRSPVPVKVYAAMDTSSAVVDESHTEFYVIGLIGEAWYHVWLTDIDAYGYIRQEDVWGGNG